jgi:hypothetical protein
LYLGQLESSQFTLNLGEWTWIETTSARKAKWRRSTNHILREDIELQEFSLQINFIINQKRSSFYI